MISKIANGKGLHLATHSGWYRFEQRGGEWVQTDRALTYWNMTCMQVDPAEPKRVYLGTEHSGLFCTINGGTEWRRAEPNVPKLMLSSLLALPGSIMAGTVPAALYRSANGSGWEELEGVRVGAKGGTFPPSPDLGSRTRYLACDPEHPGRLYAGIEVGGMLVSGDGGAHWVGANEGLEDPDVHQVLPCSVTPGLVVAACGEGIFRSLDRGARWQKVTPQGSRTYGTAVTEDAAGVIYLGISRGRPNTWLRRERADSAILASRDGGSSWQLIHEGLKGGVLDLCPGVGGQGALAATSEGEVLSVGAAGCRVVVSGLPCINALSLGV